MTRKGPTRPEPMTPPQAAELLSYAALFDNRTIGKTDAFAWAHALDNLDPVDCREAITEYYRRNSTRITVGKIREHVRLARLARDEAERNRRLFEPYDPVTNPDGVPPFSAALNVAGAALTMAAAFEAKEVRAAKTLKKARPATPVADLLNTRPELTVFELVGALGIEVGQPTGTEMADALQQMALPLDESEDEKRLRLARERARADKAARTGRTPV